MGLISRVSSRTYRRRTKNMTLTTLLRQRSLIRLAGSGGSQMKLLQGLTTNDCLKFESDENSRVMYANWLSNKGRVWFDLFLYKYQDHFLLELDSVYKTKLLLMLKIHNLEKSVIVEDTKLQVGFSEKKNGDNFYPDPRIENFGNRVISDNLNFENKEEEYIHKRYLNGIAEGCGEIIHDKSLPLCFNLDWLNGVSFKKGCYLGQELTQRTKLTGKVSKRVLPILGDVPNEFLKGRRPPVEILNKSPLDHNLKLAMVKLDRLDEMEEKGVKVLKQDWMRFDEKI